MHVGLELVRGDGGTRDGETMSGKYNDRERVSIMSEP